MSLVNEQMRALAERVAASHGLDVVDLEFQGGGGKHRTLRIFLERNAEGRAVLESRMRAMRSIEPAASTESPESPESPKSPKSQHTQGNIVLDLVDAGETAGLSPEEDELAYLRELPAGVPVEQLSGITHGDCERFSRDFGTALDIEDLIPGAEYLLEASSPGLDRKLSKSEDFCRFVGQLCKVQTFTAVNGNRHWQGHLGTCIDRRLTLLVPQTKSSKKKASAPAQVVNVELDLANIEKAQLVPEL